MSVEHTMRYAVYAMHIQTLCTFSCAIVHCATKYRMKWAKVKN